MLCQGILTRDFRLQVLFWITCPSGPRVSIPFSPFRVFFVNSRRYSRMNVSCLSAVSTTSAKSCSPVSTTLAINPCHGFSVLKHNWHRWWRFIRENFREFVKKNWKGPNGILTRDRIHEKKLKLKISCQTPFNWRFCNTHYTTTAFCPKIFVRGWVDLPVYEKCLDHAVFCMDYTHIYTDTKACVSLHLKSPVGNLPAFI
jgi:hypothetical protein